MFRDGLCCVVCDSCWNDGRETDVSWWFVLCWVWQLLKWWERQTLFRDGLWCVVCDSCWNDGRDRHCFVMVCAVLCVTAAEMMGETDIVSWWFVLCYVWQLLKWWERQTLFRDGLCCVMCDSCWNDGRDRHCFVMVCAVLCVTAAEMMGETDIVSWWFVLCYVWQLLKWWERQTLFRDGLCCVMCDSCWNDGRDRRCFVMVCAVLCVMATEMMGETQTMFPDGLCCVVL